ncbi:MAG: hypothetical protein NTW95_07725 [Candidatus Aminicenantes bacterium]|nr:hypothetical protein [Candidatus Aminicenantes bacterium]
MKRMAAIIVSWLLLSGPGALLGQELNLALWQRREAARRKAATPTRLVVDDRNIDTLSVPGTKYHFTQLGVDPPVNWDSGSGILFAPESHRVFLIRREREIEEEVAEAQANIKRYDKEIHTIEIDIAPYHLWDKPDYIMRRTAELQRWIEGEQLYIHLSKKRLAELR